MRSRTTHILRDITYTYIHLLVIRRQIGGQVVLGLPPQKALGLVGRDVEVRGAEGPPALGDGLLCGWVGKWVHNHIRKRDIYTHIYIHTHTNLLLAGVIDHDLVLRVVLPRRLPRQPHHLLEGHVAVFMFDCLPTYVSIEYYK